MPLLPILQLPQEPARLKPELPVVQTETQNTTSFCVFMRHWESLQYMRILLPEKKEAVKKAVKNSEM